MRAHVLSAGRRKSVCPYYSARRAVPEADIILAPYRQALVSQAEHSCWLLAVAPGTVVRTRSTDCLLLAQDGWVAQVVL